MKLHEIAEILPFTLRAGARGLDNDVTGGYAADLLSCAMAGARQGYIWVTLQGHLNVIAIAALNELAAIVVAEDKPITPETIVKAEAEGIPLFSTPLTTFEVAGHLWQLGVGR